MNKDLTVGKPSSVLFRFCLPLFGSIIFQQLYNIADSLVAGRFVGENALAAVGNSYEITLIFLAVQSSQTWFAFSFRMVCRNFILKDCSLVDFAAPQILPGADMVGDLRYQKRLTDLGRACEEVRSRMEQIFNDGWAAFVGGLKQLGHGERVQVVRVGHTLHLTVHFL